MSCYLIYYKDGAKYARPVFSPQELIGLRNNAKQIDLVEKARSGDGDAKRRLLQFNYSCIPSPLNPLGEVSTTNPQEGGPLKGCKVASKSVGMDVDFNENDNENENLTHAVRDRILAMKDEVGLLMLERSATKGYHIVFKRQEGLNQEENLKWASNLLGVQYDEGAKDITRVFFATTGSKDDLLFLSEELFDNTAADPQNTDPLTPFRGDTKARVDKNGDKDQSQAETSADAEEPYPYDAILTRWASTFVPSFPNVTVGLRNDTLYRICKGMRHVCEFSEAKLKAVVWPKYSWGLDEREVDSIIRSALMRDHGEMPKALRNAVLIETMGQNPEDENDVLEGLNWQSPYPSVSQCIVEEMSLPKMPKWVEKLLTPVLPGYRFITICGASTAMMTLLSDVTKKFGTKPEARLNGWTHWDGLSGSGKRQLHDVIEELIKPLRAQDAKTRELLNGIIEYNKTAKDGEKKALPPLGIRILECDTTRKAHITQMDNLKGKKTFTFAEEISSLNLNRAGYYFRGDFCRLNFDNGLVGYLNATGDSASVVTPCNWDVTTSGTHDQTLKQWQNAIADGSAQRVLICLVPDNTYQPLPTYTQYTEEDMAYISRATSLMMKLQGLVLTPKLDKALNAWVEDVRQEMMNLPKAERNDERARFRFRSNEIAHTLGVVMHCCHIVQEILDTEDSLNEKLKIENGKLEAVRSDISSNCEQIAEAERAVIAAREALETWKSTALDMSQYGELRSTIDLALYAADYCLDTQDLLWSKRLRTQQRTSFEGCSSTQSGRSRSEDEYLRLPERFKMADLTEYIPGKSQSALKKMITRFISSNMLKKVGSEKGFAVYEKVA